MTNFIEIWFLTELALKKHLFNIWRPLRLFILVSKYEILWAQRLLCFRLQSFLVVIGGHLVVNHKQGVFVGLFSGDVSMDEVEYIGKIMYADLALFVGGSLCDRINILGTDRPGDNKSNY